MSNELLASVSSSAATPVRRKRIQSLAKKIARGRQPRRLILFQPVQLQAGIAGLQVGAGIGEIAAVEAGSAQQVAHQLVAAGIAPQDPRAHRFALIIAEPDPLPLPGEADSPQPPRL